MTNQERSRAGNRQWRNSVMRRAFQKSHEKRVTAADRPDIDLTTLLRIMAPSDRHYIILPGHYYLHVLAEVAKVMEDGEFIRS